MRARTVAVGVEGVRKAVQRGDVRLVVIASDVSDNSRDKIVPLLLARRVTLLVGPDTISLGAAVGKSAVAAIGILDRNLAEGVQKALSETENAAETRQQGNSG